MASSCIFVSLTTLLIILIKLATFISPCLAAGRPLPRDDQPETQFIKTSCGLTRYPDLCFTTLSSYASKIQANPKLLVTTALNVTLDTTRSTSTTITKLSKTKNLSPREAGALTDCVEELQDSVDELKRSIGEMGHNEGKNFWLQISDIQTWVSAALTDEDTCMDGFDGKVMNGNVKDIVRTQIVNVAHMTSNALALVNNYASLTPSMEK